MYFMKQFKFMNMCSAEEVPWYLSQFWTELLDHGEIATSEQ